MTLNVLVEADAIQAEGFADAAAALRCISTNKTAFQAVAAPETAAAIWSMCPVRPGASLLDPAYDHSEYNSRGCMDE